MITFTVVVLKELANCITQRSLTGNQITDEGLVHLKGLTNLAELGLNETQVTDAGLRQLKGLTKLEILEVDGTQITDAGIAELRQALPNCKIRN